MSVGSGVSIRRATVADLDRVAPLFDAYRQFYRKASDLPLARRFLAERFERGDSTIFLALGAADASLGFVQLFPSLSSGAAARIFILNDLYVAPDARKAGVGRSLLRVAADFGRAEGAVRLTLSTELTNAPARALYEAAGWRPDEAFLVYHLVLGA
jgi:ribosomal protein S18 acetylase RimI-like enzyme